MDTRSVPSPKSHTPRQPERSLRTVVATDILIRLARILNARPVRVAFSDPDVALAAVVSGGMFRDVVRPGNGLITADCFRPIRVRVKEYGRAWLLAPQPWWLGGAPS